MRRAYQTDLSDEEWAVIEPHLPVPKATGRPRRLRPLHEILDAVFYVVRGGCAWRLLPHDLPSWKTVYRYFRLWRLNGTWERRAQVPARKVIGRALNAVTPEHATGGFVHCDSGVVARTS